VKNVLAIACGIAIGRKLGDNARAALLTRGLAEIMRLGLALGAQPATLMGLSGLGDLTLTCNGRQSSNLSLGIALGERAHVIGLRTEDAAVILSTEDTDLLAAGLRATGVHWYAPPPEHVIAQIRSRHAGAAARLERLESDTVLTHFDIPQSAVTPGQAVAFYDGEQLIGGGWIDAALPVAADR